MDTIKKPMTWIAEVKELPDGDLIIEIPDGCFPKEWKEGDSVEWIDNKDGTWTIKKVEGL